MQGCMGCRYLPACTAREQTYWTWRLLAWLSSFVSSVTYPSGRLADVQPMTPAPEAAGPASPSNAQEYSALCKSTQSFSTILMVLNIYLTFLLRVYRNMFDVSTLVCMGCCTEHGHRHCIQIQAPVGICNACGLGLICKGRSQIRWSLCVHYVRRSMCDVT